MLDKCADLLGMKENESFVFDLFSSEKGRWQRVSESIDRLGLSDFQIEDAVYVTWLDMPDDCDGYAFIVFYDIDSGESLVAEYNKKVLGR